MAHSAPLSSSSLCAPTALTPASFRGQPLVVVAAPSWPSESRPALARLRAELRGLGAALVLITPEQVFCLRPDALFDPNERDRHCDRAAFEALLNSWPAPHRSLSRRALHCRIVSPSGSCVWTRRLDSAADPLETLVSALASASRQLTEPVHGITRRELVTTLIAAFSLTFEAACRPKPQPDTAAKPNPGAQTPTPTSRPVRLRVNGADHERTLEPRVSLLDACASDWD